MSPHPVPLPVSPGAPRGPWVQGPCPPSLPPPGRPATRGQRADSPDLKKRRIHQCDFEGCNKVYTKSSHLKAHRRIHTGRGQRHMSPCPGGSGSMPPAPDGLGARAMGCTGRWWSIPGLRCDPFGVPAPCARAGGRFGSSGRLFGGVGTLCKIWDGAPWCLGMSFGGAGTLCQRLRSPFGGSACWRPVSGPGVPFGAQRAL